MTTNTMPGPATNHLPPIPTTWTTEPHNIETDYMEVIHHAITNHPRSLQTQIGPSEIGQACARRLAYKLAGHPENPGPPNWRATMGTGAHMWLEDAFDQDNIHHDTTHGSPGVERWLIEETVTVGVDTNGTPITGHCDLYDRITGTVIDHKTVGKTQLAKYKRHGPGNQYTVQANLYGLGWIAAGQPVQTVAIAFLPRDGELKDAYFWSAPFNPQVAVDALNRMRGIQAALNQAGPAILAALPTTDDYCSHCPFFKAGSTDPTTGCPGHPGSRANQPHEPSLTLTK